MKKNSFIQGAMIATIGIFISKILGIVYVIPFYAIIGEQGGALYGYAYTIYSIFLSLSSVGIPLAISRLTSEYNTLHQYKTKEKAFRVGKNIIRVLCVICFIILVVFARDIAYMFIGDVKGGNTIEDVTYVIRVIATALLVVPTLSVMKGYLQGHKFITEPTISQVIEQFARVVVIIVGSYVTVKVLHLPIKIGVGVATFGATIGALLAYFYLEYKVHHNKKELKLIDEANEGEDTDVSTKEIIVRIISYSAPFIFSSIILSLYTFVDMATITKTMVDTLHYNVSQAESVVGIISTWGNKLTTIVIAISTGLVTSLIPNITASFVKNDEQDVQNKINKSLQILMFTTLPMTVGLCVLAMPVWTIFYGYSNFGGYVFAYYIFTALVSSFFTTLNVIMQALNEQLKMFIHIFIGFLIKLFLNVPLMYFFWKIGIDASYGAISATILGSVVSIFLMLGNLHKKVKVSYKKTIKSSMTMIYACLAMTIIMLLFEFILPLNTHSRMMAMLITIIYTLIGSAVYIFIAIKSKIIKDVFGEELIKKMLSKFKFSHR